MMPQLSWRIQHTYTHTDLLSNTSIQPQLLYATHIRTKKILCFMEDCGFISPLSVSSELSSDWNSLSQTHTHTQTGSRFVSPAALCSRSLAAQLPVRPPPPYLPPPLSELEHCAPGGEEQHKLQGPRSNQGCHTQLPVHHSKGVSDLSQCTGSPRVPLGAQHNKSWNPPCE